MTSNMAIKEMMSVTKTAVQEGVKLVKKAWSIMDAAAEKTPPSSYLSPQTIASIQGKRPG